MSLATVKVGDKVVLFGFTGIRLAEVTISAADKKNVTVEKKDGKLLIFDRKTGVQNNTEEGKEKYANKIATLEDAPKKDEEEKPAKKPKAKKAAETEEAPKKKKAPKKKVVVEEDEYEEM